MIAFTIGYFSIALIGVEWLEYRASGTSTKKYTKLPKPENHNQQQVNGLLPLLPISDSGNPSESKFSQATTGSTTSTPENSKNKREGEERGGEGVIYSATLTTHKLVPTPYQGFCLEIWLFGLWRFYPPVLRSRFSEVVLAGLLPLHY